MKDFLNIFDLLGSYVAIHWQLVTDTLGQHVSPFVKGQVVEVKCWHHLGVQLCREWRLSVPAMIPTSRPRSVVIDTIYNYTLNI
jgi:hypothetical protein